MSETNNSEGQRIQRGSEDTKRVRGYKEGPISQRPKPVVWDQLSRIVSLISGAKILIVRH